MDFYFDTEKLRINPLKDSLEPSLLISTPLKYKRYGTMPLQFIGSLLLEGVTIALLNEYADSRHGRTNNELYLRQRGTKHNDLNYYFLNFIAVLTPKALDMIEQYREKNSGDVELKVRVKIHYFKTDYILGEQALQVDPAGKGERWHYVALNINERGFLTRHEDSISENITIASSDWVKTFMPALRQGEFITYNIPIIKPEYVKGPLKKRIEEAVLSIADMEKARTQCEWNSVIKESRPVLELIKKDKIALEKILVNAGFTNDAIEDFTKMLQNFHDYASKFIHKLGRGKTPSIMPTIPAQREDAELVYALAINIVNVVSTKVYRQSFI